MNPEDREVLNQLVATQVSTLETLKALDNSLQQQVANNLVLLTACGALYAELARVSGKSHHLDQMLARLTGVIEANPDSEGRVLKATDLIRGFAEALNGSGQ